jgi:hypothetical protein
VVQLEEARRERIIKPGIDVEMAAAAYLEGQRHLRGSRGSKQEWRKEAGLVKRREGSEGGARRPA